MTEQLRRMGQLIGMAVSAFRVADLKLRSPRMTSAVRQENLHSEHGWSESALYRRLILSRYSLA